MVEVRGTSVVLRPFRSEETETIWQFRVEDAAGRPPATMQPDARERLELRLAQSGRFSDGRLDLAVEAEGRLVGEVDARRPEGAMPPGVFEVGIALFPAERGKGYGREAIELLTRHLFEGAGAHRVQASTAVGNEAMQRVLAGLGFVREGVMRDFMPTVDGGRDDYYLYAVVRHEWRHHGAVAGS